MEAGGRRYLIQPSNTAAEWKLLNHAPGFWPERVSFPADFHPGVIGIFPPCCPADLTYLEHAPLLHLHPARPRNIIAQIFARDARPRPNDRWLGLVISASSRYTSAPPPSYLPYQHPVRIQRINLWLPAECLPSRRAEQAGLLLRGAWRPRDGNRVSCGWNPAPLELVPLEITSAVNKLSPCPLDRGKVRPRTCKSRFNWGHSITRDTRINSSPSINRMIVIVVVMVVVEDCCFVRQVCQFHGFLRRFMTRFKDDEWNENWATGQKEGEEREGNRINIMTRGSDKRSSSEQFIQMRLLRSGLCNRPNCQTNPGQTPSSCFPTFETFIARKYTTSSLIQSRNRIAHGTALSVLFVSVRVNNGYKDTRSFLTVYSITFRFYVKKSVGKSIRVREREREGKRSWRTIDKGFAKVNNLEEKRSGVGAKTNALRL